MGGDFSVESAKSVNRLSSILSTLCVDSTVDQVIAHSV